MRSAKGRLRVVHVIGTAADSIDGWMAAPDGWSSDTTYTAEAGWIDRAKVEEPNPSPIPNPNPNPIPNPNPTLTPRTLTLTRTRTRTLTLLLTLALALTLTR